MVNEVSALTTTCSANIIYPAFSVNLSLHSTDEDKVNSSYMYILSEPGLPSFFFALLKKLWYALEIPLCIDLPLI